MKKVLMLVLLAGGVAAVAKLVTAKKAEWQGMTESDVRAKLDDRLPERVPADKRAAITDKVVSKMREKGALVTEAPAVEGAPATEST